MGEHLDGGAVHGQAGIAHDQQPVRHPGHIVHGMADHHDGGILRFAVAVDVFQDLFPTHRIQSRGGLVQDQDLRLHGDDAGNGHTALLTA